MNDMNEKTNDLYDCDPADCNGYNQSTKDNDADAQNENNSQNKQSQNYDYESTAQDEQAAATDEQSANGYDADAQNENNSQSEQSQNYDYESTAQDEQAAATDEQQTNDYDVDAQNEQNEQNAENATNGNKCERNVFDDPQTDEYMPADEQAATTDGCGCSSNSKNSDCSTITAQSRCALDDYEIISDVLGTEKNLVKLYSTAICECAEENLIDTVRQNMCACAADQHKTFMFMSKHDMYPTEEAPEKKIKQAKEQFCPLCK